MTAKFPETGEHTMADARRISSRWNFAIGKLTNDDQPYFVARDGHIIRQFRTAACRANWLEEYDLINEPRSYPEPRHWPSPKETQE